MVKKPNLLFEDEFAIEIEAGVVSLKDLEGVTMPLEDYLKGKEKDEAEVREREKTLRAEMTNVIRNHLQKIPLLATMDWATKCRQLSWALEDRGEAVLASLPLPSAITQSRSEAAATMHYLRAYVASLYSIVPLAIIPPTISPTVKVLIDPTEDSPTVVLNRKIALWCACLDLSKEDNNVLPLATERLIDLERRVSLIEVRLDLKK